MPDDAGSAAPSGHAVADADRLTVEAVEVGVNLEPCPVAHLPAREGHVKTRGAPSIRSVRPHNWLGVEDSNLGIRIQSPLCHKDERQCAAWHWGGPS